MTRFWFELVHGARICLRWCPSALFYSGLVDFWDAWQFIVELFILISTSFGGVSYDSDP